MTLRDHEVGILAIEREMKELSQVKTHFADEEVIHRLQDDDHVSVLKEDFGLRLRDCG